MSQHIIPVRTYLIVFGVLMGLLVATVAGAYAPLGHFHLAIALLIAGLKAVVIVLYFMHVRYSSRLTWVFSSAAVNWRADGIRRNEEDVELVRLRGQRHKTIAKVSAKRSAKRVRIAYCGDNLRPRS